MLNIPESVKALFRQDGARKNFRAHFPNGEMPDITNKDIIQESVKFTESLCSQDVLKFGLTEASVIEFETVGIGNMYGLMIECSCEIDLSGLSESELEAIAAGEWDGEYVPVSNSDTGYAFYRVPYGIFRVESCPRNAETMARRQVTAYTLEGRRELENPFETAKNAMLLPGLANYTPNAKLLALSALSFQNPNTLKRMGYAMEEITDYTSNSGDFVLEHEITLQLVRKNGNPVTVLFYMAYEYLPEGVFETAMGTRPTEALYAVETHKEKYLQGVKKAAIEILEEEEISLSLSNYANYEDLLQPLLAVAAPFISFHSYVSSSTQYAGPFGEYQFSQSNYAIYFGTENIGVRFERPKSLSAIIMEDIDADGTPDFVNVYSAAWHVSQPAQIFKWVAPSGDVADDDIKLLFGNTGKGKTEHNLTGYSFIDAFSQHDIAAGWLELQALFAVPERKGGYSIKRLGAGGTLDLRPADYSSLWWDEFAVQPIGKILLSYVDEEGSSQDLEYKFSENPSSYDLTGNTLLANVYSATAEKLQTLVDKYFIPNLAPVNFTPIDISMKGMPFAEAGDKITAIAEDGTVVESYNMNCTQNGIQILQAAITSTSGQILDSEEAVV